MTTTTTTAAAASSANTAQTTSNTAMQQIAGNFDTFLQLLTTQLKTRTRSIRSIPTSLRKNWSSSPRSASRST